MTTFRSVVDSWRHADPKMIHPTREHVSEQAYWESGKPQAELIHELLPDGGTVLDFGCGDGRIAIPLAKLGCVVYAVDASQEMLVRLQQQTGWREIDRIVLSDGTNIPTLFPEPVDAVNARAVLIHHSHTDVIRLVRNLTKVIRPGGFLVADWPVGKHHERRDWIDVTTWDKEHRDKVAASVGLELVSEGVPTVSPSVWRKK